LVANGPREGIEDGEQTAVPIGSHQGLRSESHGPTDDRDGDATTGDSRLMQCVDSDQGREPLGGRAAVTSRTADGEYGQEYRQIAKVSSGANWCYGIVAEDLCERHSGPRVNLGTGSLHRCRSDRDS
jgi:hypothetical protein